MIILSANVFFIKDARAHDDMLPGLTVVRYKWKIVQNILMAEILFGN